MSKHQTEKRAAKIEGRRAVAQALASDAFVTRGMLLQFANMGFFRRLGWVLFGIRALPKARPAPQNLMMRRVAQ